MANILVTAGWLMKLGDGSAYWSLKERLESLSHTVVLRQCEEMGNGPSLEDLLAADVIIVYSYGTATLWDIMHKYRKQIAAAKKQWKGLIIVAGVPDWALGQLYGSIWHAPEFFDRAVCFQVTAIPASAQLENVDVVQIPLTEFCDGDVVDNVHINVDCDGHHLDHIKIAEDETVLNVIEDTADQLASLPLKETE